MTRLRFFVATATLILTGYVLVWATSENKGAAAPDLNANEAATVAAAAAPDTKLQTASDRLLDGHLTVQEVWEREESQQPVITDSDFRHTLAAFDFSRSILDDREAYPDLLLARAAAVNSEAALNLKNYRVAMSSAGMARQMLEAEFLATDDESVLAELSSIINLQCCALTQVGRYDQALEVAVDGFEIARQIAIVDEVSLQTRINGTISLRNQALLQAALGKPSLQTSRQATDEFQAIQNRIADPATEATLRLPEMILDSCLLTVGLASEHDDRQAAELAVKQAVEQIDVTEKLVAQISGKAHSISTRRLIGLRKTLADWMQANKQSAPNLLDFVDLQLQRFPGKAIHPELLIHAMLRPEFETQHGMVLVWDEQSWKDEGLRRLVSKLSQQLKVYVLLDEIGGRDFCRELLAEEGSNMANISFETVSTGSRWVRDFGPFSTQVSGKRRLLIDPVIGIDIDNPRPADEVASASIAQALNSAVMRTSLYIQGGEVLVNGAGLCVASEMLLKRNLHWGHSEDFVVATLKRITGATEVVFLEPLIDEPTQHIDWFVTFPQSGTAVVGQYQDPDDPNAVVLNRNADRLSKVVLNQNEMMRIERVPMPARQDGWFGGTFTNVVYANGVLFIPQWEGVPAEVVTQVAGVYQSILPDWEIVQIPSDAYGRQSGSLHCLTLNIGDNQ